MKSSSLHFLDRGRHDEPPQRPCGQRHGGHQAGGRDPRLQVTGDNTIEIGLEHAPFVVLVYFFLI